MTEMKKDLGAIVLLILISLCNSRPHARSQRSIIKDYFNPLTYPTSPLQFQKGEDGKYHPLSMDSKVEYVMAKELDAKNAVANEEAKSINSEGVGDATAVSKTNDMSLGEFEEVSKKELAKKENTFPKKYSGEAKIDLELTKLIDAKELDAAAQEKEKSLESEVKSEDAEKKIDVKELEEDSKTLVEPVRPKYTIMPKPDGKDDKPYEGQFTPGEDISESSLGVEKEEEDGQLGIGQIPLLLPPFVPHGIQLLMRPRHFSFGALSLMPVPPAVHISDRLPMPEADVMEEKSESTVIEDVATGDKVVKGTRQVAKNHISNPLAFGLPLPLIPFQQILKEIADEDKVYGSAKSEILDIMGRKMLMQKKVLKYPGEDNSNVYLRVMSVRPLEHVDPKVLKELDVEKGTEKEKKAPFEPTVEEKEIDSLEKKFLVKKETSIEKEDENTPKKVDPLEKLFPESEILRVEETQINEKVFNEAEDEVTKTLIEKNSEDEETKEDTTIDEAKPTIVEESMVKTKLGSIDLTSDEEKVLEVAESKVDIHKSLISAEEKQEVMIPKGSLPENDETAPDQKPAVAAALGEEARNAEDAAMEVIESFVEPKELKIIESEAEKDEGMAKENYEESLENVDKINELGVISEKKQRDETDGKKEAKFPKDTYELEVKELNIEDIKPMKIEGVLFQDRKKKLVEEKEEKEVDKVKSKEGKNCNCDESKESDSDSEDD